MSPTLQHTTVVGGIALLVYGMRVVGNELQQAAGVRLRRFTVNRFRVAALGTAVTALMQILSATAVLLVSLGWAAGGRRVAGGIGGVEAGGRDRGISADGHGDASDRVERTQPAAPDRQRAHIFNLTMLVVLLPLATPFAWLVRTIVSEPRRTELRAEDYLDPATLSSPTVAIGQATRAILRMAKLVQTMVRNVINAMDSGDESLVIEVRERDEQVDALQRSIRHYLTRLDADPELEAETSAREIGLLYVINDLENIVDKNLAELALKKLRGQHEFSADGMADLRQFDRRVAEEFDWAIAAFAASGERRAAGDGGHCSEGRAQRARTGDAHEPHPAAL